MLETFSIGGSTISSIYVAIGVALLVAYLIIWNSDQKKHLFNKWLNAVIILFLVSKLSYIPFSFNEFINDPAGLFYGNGGNAGFLIGLIVMFAYLVYRSDSLFFAESFSIFNIAFITLYSVLELRVITQWPYITLALVSLGALIAMYFMRGRFRAVWLIFISLFVMQLTVRFLIYNGDTVLSMSMIQWWILGSIIYVMLTTQKGMKDKNGPQLP